MRCSKFSSNSTGVLPVVAIGNENYGNSSSTGNVPHAFAIGAVEKMPRRKLDVASFSSGAMLVFPGNEPNTLVTKPDVVAPGVQIYSCIRRKNAPTVCSSMPTWMELQWQLHTSPCCGFADVCQPDTPVTQIVDALKTTAKHPGGPERQPDNRWGYGIINRSRHSAGWGDL